MTLRAPLRVIRLMLVALVALALTASAFAHRMPADPDLLAFARATGASVADICGDPAPGALGQPSCDACQIASLMPPAQPCTALVALELVPATPTVPKASTPPHAVHWNKAHPPQGPPAA